MSYPIAANVPASGFASAYPGDARQARQLLLEATEILDVLGQAIGRDLDAARAAALQLVRLLTPKASTRSLPARGGLAPWQKQKIDRYLADHIEEPILVETLADELPLSVSHFCRAFKETFGETPHAHVMRLRLERAQHLMLATREPLSQIAAACGLTDQAHLSKLFRRHLAESPRTWRRRHLRDPQREVRP
ncbi:MAG: helix-turn-helix domain-containing protein [Phenylobacterium sp.]